MLSPAKYRRIASWICGWLYVVGNITITLAVNFGTTLFFVGCINVFKDKDGNGVFAGETYQIFLIFLGITILCNLVSSLGNKWLPWLDVSPQSQSSPARIISVANSSSRRPLPFSGLLLVSSPSSSPFLPLPRTVATMPNGSSLILKPSLAGLTVGLSWLVCFTLAMPLLPQA